MMIMIYIKSFINNENDILITIKNNIINDNKNIIKNIINKLFTIFI